MDWQATELNTAWRHAFMSLVRQGPDYRDGAAAAASVRAWNARMAVLERQLERSDAFVVGADFTPADVVLGLSTHRWYSTAMERSELPSVRRYYDRLGERPGFRRHGRDGVP